MTSLRAAAVSALAALLLAVAPPAGAQTDPPSGRYQARPAAVLACGSILGVCDYRVLEGWIEIEVVGLPIPGSPSMLRITGSELRLLGPGGGGQPFPPADTVQLAELTPGSESGRHLLTATDDASGSSARLEVIPSFFERDERFLLTGAYSEGCCDRFDYDLGYVLFDRVEEGAATPLLLLAGRFRVEVEWRTAGGGSGFGVPVVLGDRSARFWFFRADNPELLVKVVPACTPFGRNWFFAAGLTDVGVTIRVTDLATGVERSYENPLGQAFQPIQDTTGFPCG